MTSFAAFIKESRMSFAEPIALNRKSGAAEGSAVPGLLGRCAIGKKQSWGFAHLFRPAHPGFPVEVGGVVGTP
jgi:hypothetical protein